MLMPGLYVRTRNEEVHIVVARAGGLKKWFKQKWVNIGAPKKNGKFQPCGRKKAKKGKKAVSYTHLTLPTIYSV